MKGDNSLKEILSVINASVFNHLLVFLNPNFSLAITCCAQIQIVTDALQIIQFNLKSYMYLHQHCVFDLLT